MVKKKTYTRALLALSVVIMIVWGLMGAGTSLAWFTDTDADINNVFHFADFDVLAEYRDKDGNWKDIEAETEIFDRNALYEPGYTQVIYLRVTNKGDVPFDFKTAVVVKDYSEPINVLGQKFHLQDYLTFGLTPAVGSEQEMDALVADRVSANAYATMDLGNYATEVAELDDGQTVYMALVVHMPEDVGNVANYTGDTVPEVFLGLIVTAMQQTKN